MNPAEYMLQFFKIEKRDDEFDDGISTSFSRMHDAETCLDNLIKMNVRRLGTTKSVMPQIWQKLWESYTNPSGNGYWVGFSTSQQRDVPLDAAEAQALEIIADKSPSLPISIAEEERKTISEFLDEALKAVREDDSLPTSLRVYVLDLISEARRNLDEYAAGKEFDLKVSLQALFGVLYMAESQTGKPTVWENLKSKIAKPFISALLSEGARQLVASGASFLQLPG